MKRRISISPQPLESIVARRRRAGPTSDCVLALTFLLASCGEGTAPAPGQTTSPSTPVVGPTGAQTLTRDTPSGVVDSEPLFNGQPPPIQVSDASAEPDVTNALLQTCTPTTGTGQNPLIDDFEDGDEVLTPREGLNGAWYQYEQSAGDHHLTITELTTPRLDSRWAAHTAGSDHGEWAGIGVALSAGCVYDASRYVGVHFWIRGQSAPIYVALLTPGVIPYSQGGTCTKEEEGLCWDAYRASITVTEQWREVFIPFSSFEQLGYGPNAGAIDLTRLESLQFQSQPSAFELWIDDVSFYVEEVYTPFDAGTSSGTSSTDAGAPSAVDASTPPDATDASSMQDAGNDGGSP